jgi:two-component system, LytTR family, response regulator
MSERSDHRWRVAIVDDEPPARHTLRLLLAPHQDFEIVAECGHGQEAIAAIRSDALDVLFLDVQMPGMDGFDVLRTVGVDAVPALVFVTAYDRYALQAFETHALDYLLKPFSDERFAEVLARLRKRLHERSLAATGRRLSALLESRRPQAGPRQLVVRDAGRTLVIPYDDIVWIEAEDYYACVHTRERRTLVRLPLKTLADELDAARFVRVHRSAIVNVSCVREVEPLASGDSGAARIGRSAAGAERRRRAAREPHVPRRSRRAPGTKIVTDGAPAARLQRRRASLQSTTAG